ncbi:hypothetical protein AKO1_012891, partial [Acrasis kona]
MTQESILDGVRRSCRQASSSSSQVRINKQKLEEFSKGLAEEATTIKNKFSRADPYPLKFDPIEFEINFNCIYALLSFGSGYTKELDQHVGKGLDEILKYGLLSMTLSGANLDTEFMVKFTISDVENYFRIPIQEEVQHPTNPIVRIGQNTSVQPFAEYIRYAMNDCGNVLSRRGHKDFASFINSTLQENSTAAHLIQQVTKTFPHVFNDESAHSSTPPIQVLFHKKAQLLVINLYRQLKTKNSIFDFSDISQLTCLAEPIVFATLIEKGILEGTSEGTTPINGIADEVELRAQSVVAVEDMINKADALSAAEVWLHLSKSSPAVNLQVKKTVM